MAETITSSAASASSAVVIDLTDDEGTGSGAPRHLQRTIEEHEWKPSCPRRSALFWGKFRFCKGLPKLWWPARKLTAVQKLINANIEEENDHKDHLQWLGTRFIGVVEAETVKPFDSGSVQATCSQWKAKAVAKHPRVKAARKAWDLGVGMNDEVFQQAVINECYHRQRFSQKDTTVFPTWQEKPSAAGKLKPAPVTLHVGDSVELRNDAFGPTCDRHYVTTTILQIKPDDNYPLKFKSGHLMAGDDCIYAVNGVACQEKRIDRFKLSAEAPLRKANGKRVRTDAEELRRKAKQAKKELHETFVKEYNAITKN